MTRGGGFDARLPRKCVCRCTPQVFELTKEAERQREAFEKSEEEMQRDFRGLQEKLGEALESAREEGVGRAAAEERAAEAERRAESLREEVAAARGSISRLEAALATLRHER